MRVCHVISGDQWAGAEVMVFHLLKGLKQYPDLDLSAILLNEGKVAEEFRELDIPVRIADETNNNSYRLLNRFKDIISEISPSVIHSHRLKENILAFYSSKSTRNIKLICTQHGASEPLEGKIKVLKRMLLSKFHFSILSRHFKYVVAVSEDLKNTLTERGKLGTEKVIMIHNGIFMPKCTVSKERKSEFVIGSAGRLFPVKDYPLMVRVACEIVKKNGKVVFRLAGEGPEKNHLLNMINKMNIAENFFLTGFINNMEDFYRELDLYINTSIHEGLPMSILEAMAYGLPVIAPNTGGIREIIVSGHDGFLIDGRDPKLFADKCMKLYNDRQLLAKMGESSKSSIMNNFSFEKMADQYHALYVSGN